MQVFINNDSRFCYKGKKNYCPQTLLEECKYEQNKIKLENLIDDDLEKISSDESGSEFDNDKSND